MLRAGQERFSSLNVSSGASSGSSNSAGISSSMASSSRDGSTSSDSLPPARTAAERNTSASAGESPDAAETGMAIAVRLLAGSAGLRPFFQRAAGRRDGGTTEFAALLRRATRARGLESRREDPRRTLAWGTNAASPPASTASRLVPQRRSRRPDQNDGDRGDHALVLSDAGDGRKRAV